MKRHLPASLALSLLITLTVIPVSTHGQSAGSADPFGGDAEDDAPVQRVARLSFIEGDVSFLRAGVEEWAEAVENLPLFTGDQLYTARRSRVEIQLGRGNYVRLAENSALTISDLSHTVAQFELTEGTAMIRLERFGTAFGRFEVDTPNVALVLRQDGLYRVNVRGDEQSEVIARRGSVEVTTRDGSFTLREGNVLNVDSSSRGRLEIAADTGRDDWDRWSYDRDVIADRYASSSPSYVSTYETQYNSFYGVSDLAGYGSWSRYSSYGDCWIPRVSAGWAPYRHGQWLWTPYAGWTWLSTEPWGWAPYHYGRWDHIPGIGWAWIPGFGSTYYNYGHSHYQWRPALVSFFNCPTPGGNYIGWYPLRPGERWRRPNDYRARGNHSHLQYPSPRDGWRRPGSTVLPVDGFTRPGSRRVRPEAPSDDVRRWLSRGIQPGLPDMPGRPAYGPTARSDDTARNGRAVRPPDEVLRRPVVTRNRPIDPLVEESARRERRLLVGRRSGPYDVPMPTQSRPRNGDRDQDDRAGSTRPSSGPAQSTPSDGSDRSRRARSNPIDSLPVTPEAPERKRGRPDESFGARPGDQTPRNESRPSERSRPRVTPEPPPRSERPTGEPPNNDPANRRSRPYSDDRSSRRDDAQTNSRPSGGEHHPRSDSPPPRPSEPRQERPQARPEPKQDRQERRQERNEQRGQRTKN